MDPEPLPRKLVAILYADVAEYSRLTGEDEDATHRRLAQYLDLLTATVDSYGGEVMNFAGDAALAKFEAIVDALSCAARIQSEIKIRNDELAEDKKVQFRIGVNLADVIEDRRDIYGDGVNVAARLESLAAPGGICVSESVHSAIGSKLPFEYEFLGEREVKNIVSAVKVYQIHLKPGAELPEPTGVSKRKRQIRRQVAVAAGVALMLSAGGLVAWFEPWETAERASPLDRTAFEVPDKPSIAVLPFENMSDDPKQEYFADGVTEDLTTDLSKLSGLFVVARDSSFAYKGKPLNVQDVARELGVRYVLEGSVRRSDGQIRINAQLIDGFSGGHLWAERYDASMTDIFALQDKVTQNVVTALAVRLTEPEREHQEKNGDPKAYDAFLRGRAYYNLSTPEDYARALPYFEKAIQLDPGYPRAHAWLAAMYWNLWNEDWQATLEMTADQAIKKLELHLEAAMADPTPMAHYVAAAFYAAQGRYDEAIAQSNRAILMDPNSAIGYKGLGRILNKAGRPEEGLEVIKKATRLDPRGDDGGDDTYRIGEALFLLGRYEEAATMFRRYIDRSGDEEWGSLLLAANYAQLGRTKDAEAAIARFDEIRAKRGLRPYTLAEFDDWAFAPSVRERYRESLRKAGMQPGASSSPVLAGVNLAPNEVEGAMTIDAARAKALLDEGVTFVDVRGKDPAWHLGRIPGAVHLHLYHDFSEEKLTKLVAKEDPLVIYASGLRSRESGAASARAVSWGFENVYFFREGFPGWRGAGYAVEVASQ
ncbi:MAG: adenylate/guanylate cyclase domain-containing protein [Kiloniellales bacterium]|nr:adenylate/guanylate cyclase domain-containing protein [Kiloniellales bacterium]